MFPYSAAQGGHMKELFLQFSDISPTCYTFLGRATSLTMFMNHNFFFLVTERFPKRKLENYFCSFPSPKNLTLCFLIGANPFGPGRGREKEGENKANYLPIRVEAPPPSPLPPRKLQQPLRVKGKRNFLPLVSSDVSGPGKRGEGVSYLNYSQRE